MQWTIKRKLFLGFGLAAILMVGCTAIARWSQVRAQATQDSIVKTYGLLNSLEHLDTYMGKARTMQRGYLISGDERTLAGLASLRGDAKDTMARVTAAVKDDPEQAERFTRWQNDLLQRRTFTDQMNKLRKEQGFEAAKALFANGEDDRLANVQEVEFNAIKTTALSQLETEEANNQQLQHTIAWTEMLTVLMALVLLTFIALALSRSITRNVQVSVDLVEAMAQKDLTIADGEPSGEDELSDAILAINRMKQSMTDTLVEVSRSSTQVSAAGEEIETTARQMADATHVEQKNVDQFASSIAEMNATVHDVASHADHASAAASDAVSSAKLGREVVHHTQEAMNRISTTVKTASGDISNLGAETESIGEVVRIIEEIAGQTNLLALNAAIEAARAGEQGKGFAVVAQEVRQLAERTAKFTKEIAGKIKSVQQGADRAVQSMQLGETVVSEGVNQFNQVSESLEAIMQRIEAAQQGIALIATAATQQSTATAELTESIHGISSEVDHTTQRVDQTAAACTELSKLAAGLQNLVNTFQLPAEKNQGAANRPSSFQRRT
jgi:methyl-accepting chemotaxis protein